MKIAGFKVKFRYKPARIISDMLSLGVCLFAVVSTILFVERFPELKNIMFRADLVKLWAFPAAMAVPIVVYAVLVHTNHSFSKYAVTAENAQSVYEWFAFAVSLCNLPLLILIADLMTTFQARLSGSEVSWFSMNYILYILLAAIIIRFSMHRIKSLTKPADKPQQAESRIKIRVRTLDDDNKKGK